MLPKSIWGRGVIRFPPGQRSSSAFFLSPCCAVRTVLSSAKAWGSVVVRRGAGEAGEAGGANRAASVGVLAGIGCTGEQVEGRTRARSPSSREVFMTAAKTLSEYARGRQWRLRMALLDAIVCSCVAYRATRSCNASWVQPGCSGVVVGSFDLERTKAVRRWSKPHPQS